jgi:outer membrane protein assembly factor BamB
VFVREEDMVLTVGDTLYYFPDKENRHQSERIEREIPTTKNSYIRNPVIFDDMIYVFTKTKILALHLGTLKTVWTESGENNKPIPSACTPVLSNGVLAYVRGGITSNFNKQGGNTYIVFVNCNTGEHICSFSFHTVLSQPVAISGIFFVQTGQGVYACYPRKNKRENVYDKALTPTVSHFTTDSSYVATRVCPFSLENIISGGFDLSWTADGAGDLVGPSSVSDSGVLYAASEDDNLVWAYSIQNGRQIYSHTSGEVWLHETGGSVITTAPVVL